MPSLQQRSYQLELLDQDDIPFDAIQRNLQELNTINQWLGGHAITIKGIKHLITTLPRNQPLRICEIGCGGGDNLQAIANWCNRKKIQASFIGIDIKENCIQYAQQRTQLNDVTWITSDYRHAQLADNPPTIIFNSLFCHHFSEPALVEMVQWMTQQSTHGWFINDLHRHPLAYHSIKWITQLFSGSYLVKHDAPLSVARGFTQPEWHTILQQAQITNYSIRWKWAFRHLITYRHG